MVFEELRTIGRDQLSIRKMSEVWESGRQDGGSLLVLLALADFADDDGYCWPAVGTIAEKSRLSERHTRKILRQLEQEHEIESEQGRGGRGKTTRYKVVLKPGHNARVRQKTGLSDAVNPVADDPRTVKNRRPTGSSFHSEPADLFPETEVIEPERVREDALFQQYLLQFHNGARPGNSIIGKNRKIAKWLSKELDDEAVKALLRGIPKTYPLNAGAWDMFKLRKYAGDAIANGTDQISTNDSLLGQAARISAAIARGEGLHA